MTAEITIKKIEPALLTVEQTCRFLNIGKTLLYSRLSSEVFGVLPLRAGRKVLFSQVELEVYIHASTLAGHLIPRQQWQEMRKELMK